jgi:hypothetical protein
VYHRADEIENHGRIDHPSLTGNRDNQSCFDAKKD